MKRSQKSKLTHTVTSIIDLEYPNIINIQLIKLIQMLTL